MFGTRDLALLLPDKAGDLVSLRHTEEKLDDLVIPKVVQDKASKVTRYFPGKAPSWLEPTKADDVQKVSSSDTKSGSVQDSRLARLSKIPANSSESHPTRRRIYEAEVVELSEDDEEIPLDRSSESHMPSRFDEDDIIQRRERMKEALMTAPASVDKTNIKKSTAIPDDGDDNDDDDDSDNSSYDSEDEEESQHIKPVFVRKENRQTLKEYQNRVDEEVLYAKKRDTQLQMKKQQTREMVAETIKRNEEAAAAVVTDDDTPPDDSDDIHDPDIELQNWKIRELQRLKRDSEQREISILEKADLERRRNMTEDERYKEDIKLGKFDQEEKKKWKFLQKYYHKGAFYMDEDSLQKAEIRTREFNEPTLEDKFNKESLPAIMQVKKFGMRGRTKYTHLVDQDTTDYTSPLLQKDRIRDLYMNRGAGVGDIERSIKRSKPS